MMLVSSVFLRRYRPCLVLQASLARLRLSCLPSPVRVVWVVLNLATDQLLQEVINVHVMHSSSQLDACTGGRRIADALYTVLECSLYLLFCFGTCIQTRVMMVFIDPCGMQASSRFLIPQ